MWFSTVRSLVAFQLAAAASAFAIFGFWPPAEGQMLLVPFDGSNQGAVANVALAGGAALVRGGRLPGSLVVSGNRSDIAAHLEGHHILILAASGLTCGRGVRG